MTGAYAAISDSVHSSLVGVQIYATENYGEGIHDLSIHPSYDPLRTVGTAVAYMALLMTLLDVPYNRYLDEVGDTDDWQQYAQRWVPLRPEVLMKVTKLGEKVEEMLKDLRTD